MAATQHDWRALRAVLALAAALCYAGHVSAQDPRASLAQEAARAWLAHTDRGDATASWNDAGKQFRNAITVERWAQSLNRVRPPLGAVSQRALLKTQFRKTFPGAPDGEYAVVVFRTTFAKKANASETVTLEHESDSAWRVVGYFVQ